MGKKNTIVKTTVLKSTAALWLLSFSIAVAKLHVKMYDFEYDEFISFHRFDGHWLIVNKMITDISASTTHQ
jgi:hypothetical protein